LTVLRVGNNTGLNLGDADQRAAIANEGQSLCVRVSAPGYEGMQN
jgi:hypothetical protein